MDTPEGVEIVRRDGCVIIMNHNDHKIHTGINGTSLISGQNFDGTLEAYGVEWIVAE